jgi:protein-S-isoprenylcysteine O-methyltransferase Ste14
MNSDILFRILFWILIGLMLGMRVFFTLKVRRSGSRVMPDRAAIQREGIAAFLIRFVAFFALIGLLVAYAVYPAWISALTFPLPDWLRWVGFLLALAGFGLALWAQIILGSQWSAQVQLQTGHHLITGGPYARMRHPIYSALALWAVGLALLTAHWIFAAFGLLACGIFIFRVPREEQMMIDQFGDEYREYMKRTGRIIPKI